MTVLGIFFVFGRLRNKDSGSWRKISLAPSGHHNYRVSIGVTCRRFEINVCP